MDGVDEFFGVAGVGVVGVGVEFGVALGCLVGVVVGVIGLLLLLLLISLLLLLLGLGGALCWLFAPLVAFLELLIKVSSSSVIASEELVVSSKVNIFVGVLLSPP